MAVASAGPHASLHLAPDTLPPHSTMSEIHDTLLVQNTRLWMKKSKVLALSLKYFMSNQTITVMLTRNDTATKFNRLPSLPSQQVFYTNIRRTN